MKTLKVVQIAIGEANRISDVIGFLFETAHLRGELEQRRLVAMYQQQLSEASKEVDNAWRNWRQEAAKAALMG